MINKIKVKVYGLNLTRIIEALIDKGAMIENLKIKQKYAVFFMNEENKNLLKEVCALYKKRYDILSTIGIKNVLKKLPYYIGSMLAFLFSMIVVISYNSYVFNVNVSYSSDRFYDLTAVKTLLEENKVITGAPRRNIDCNDVQKLILSNCLDIAGCTVTKNGGRIDVMIYPATVKNEIQKKNIVSKYNAVITGVDVFVGTSKVKVGDVVKQGDTLIENKDGAAGKITGKVYFSDNYLYNEKQIKQVETDKILEYREIELFGIKLQKHKKNYENSKFIKQNCVFYLTNNYFLPIKIIKTQLKEVAFEEVIVPFDTVEIKLKEELSKSIKQNMPDEYKITNTTFSVVRENNYVRLDCFIECEIDLTK